jgi:hypothetical protein
MTHAILIGLVAPYVLWVFYLAVMSLKHAQDAGLLTRTAKVLGYPVLIVGYLLDCAVNALVLSVLLVELPRELTVTARLKRHNQYSTGWRKAVARWAEPLLDPFDPSGDHI